MKRFSERLISLRKERDMTQVDLATATKKQRSTISGYETEGKEPDFDTLCFLAEYFEVSTDYLLGRDTEKKHADVVFRNDNINFKRHYDALPPELKPIVTELFDYFYVLLSRDMVNNREERLTLYRDLMKLLQGKRAAIKQHIERGAGITDATFLSELMAYQNELKAGVADILDRLMQADGQAFLPDVNFGTKAARLTIRISCAALRATRFSRFSSASSHALRAPHPVIGLSFTSGTSGDFEGGFGTVGLDMICAVEDNLLPTGYTELHRNTVVLYKLSALFSKYHVFATA